ncbi:MAG: hypothetical protein AM326_06740 [Candidatus Thorarchaeota archaeon SMTZ-45]|nr:MAG: hypothetical protein AM325_05645 [Candidatus Thorarchaeota archaeon SMTZ1-45]KXH76681.1 MAG: hypothetical protein AM326_06740 [Candidatus Thorarchaeota archaeon SMTZ-45]
MVTHFDDEHLAVSPQIIVRVVRDAHEFFMENKIDERYETMALDLVRRFVSKEGVPREVDPFFGAALYMVTRHPWSYPNPLTKTEFASKLRMKESSLEWYTDSIVEKLGFTTLHDNAHLPFFMDPQGIIASVVNSVVSSSVGEVVVRGIVSGSPASYTKLADSIVDRLCNVVKIVPTIFEQDVHNLVRRKIEEESKKLSDQLSRRE